MKHLCRNAVLVKEPLHTHEIYIQSKVSLRTIQGHQALLLECLTIELLMTSFKAIHRVIMLYQQYDIIVDQTGRSPGLVVKGGGS